MEEKCVNCHVNFEKRDKGYHRYALDREMPASGKPARIHLEELTGTAVITPASDKNHMKFLCGPCWNKLNSAVRFQESCNDFCRLTDKNSFVARYSSSNSKSSPTRRKKPRTSAGIPTSMTNNNLDFKGGDNQEDEFPDVIELNVGGSYYTTTLATLRKKRGNKLSAMFSGNYFAVKKDEEGRFFIDADGSNFIHILNYLRYDVLPPQNLAEIVYREANYFGIKDLVKQLERFPAILSKIQRDNFRKSFPGYQEWYDSIIKLISETKATFPTTDVMLLVNPKEKSQSKGPAQKENPHASISFPADITMGPWKVDVSERDIMSCIFFDLKAEGFDVTLSSMGDCDYKASEKSCHKKFYKFTFNWWKNAL